MQCSPAIPLAVKTGRFPKDPKLLAFYERQLGERRTGTIHIPATREGKDLPGAEQAKIEAARKADAERAKNEKKPSVIQSLMTFGRQANG
ncbi:MAG: hypothetical protein COA37_04825 [Hoeflea sp.]|nr:MAG: hypothetical protein COA37_04825 [Hoeflea sp.]